MQTAFALLCWPVAGIILVLLLPRDDAPDKEGQAGLAQFAWLFTMIAVTDLIGDHFHTSNYMIRILCGPIHGAFEFTARFLLMISSVVPLFLWRYNLRRQKRKLTPTTATP
jgi:hypothetical protein